MTSKRLPPVSQRISMSMLHNSRLFLRRAAEEIASHDDHADRPFDADRATLIVVMIQTAVELGSIASIVSRDGLAGVMRKDLPLTEAESEARWQAGEIRTRQFEDLKKRASELFGSSDFWDLIDDFQVLRNKLVHFHRPLAKGDLYDLKYETTHVLIQMILMLSEIDEYDLPEGSASFLGRDLFEKLIALEPYRYRVEQLARDIDRSPLKCIMCDIDAYSPSFGKCLGCGFELHEQLLECPSCKRDAVFYDNLNLPFNKTLLGRCGACEEYCRTAHCSICELDYAVGQGESVVCPWTVDHA